MTNGAGTAAVHPPVPIFRSFDEAKAREFYLDWLGFEVTFEHRFEPDAPLYMGVRLGDCEIHLSEHHGDASPGGAIRIPVADLDTFHAEITAKGYRYSRPGIVRQPWGREVKTGDPFGNRLIFHDIEDG